MSILILCINIIARIGYEFSINIIKKRNVSGGF